MSQLAPITVFFLIWIWFTAYTYKINSECQKWTFISEKNIPSTSMINISNKLSLSNLNVFQLCGMAKIFQNTSHTSNYIKIQWDRQLMGMAWQTWFLKHPCSATGLGGFVMPTLVVRKSFQTLERWRSARHESFKMWSW